MSKSISNIKELERHLNKKIENAMRTHVSKTVKNIQQEKVWTEVYDKYETEQNYANPKEPYKHDRRTVNGGLADQRNMVSTYVTRYGDNGGVDLIVENLTTGADEDFEIAGLVEYGDNNGYGEYQYKENRDGTAWQYLRARPFIEETKRELNNGSAISSLKKGLISQGLDIT